MFLQKKMASTALQVVVSPFLGIVFDKLSSLIHTDFGLIWGVKKEMKKLSRTLSTIKYVLSDAEEKQLTDSAVQDWLKELKDAAYDADDVFDECATKGLQLAWEMKDNLAKKVSDSLEQLSFRHKIGKDIKELRERFNEIAEERPKFHLQKGIVEKRVEICPGRESGSLLTEPHAYGRDEDKENLVRLLLNNVNSQEDISVCPILGIGGLGKTTLAQLVYNDERIADHFKVRPWVCMSNDSDVKCVVKDIIVSLSRNACALEKLDPLQHRLQEELHGKRFLLVLDDVWQEDQGEWNKLKGSLRCGAKGSSILLTTRLKTVASITGTTPPYCLKVLSNDDCWSLFKQRAFGMGNEERPALVDVGKEIVEKCGGLPLAANALGGLMRFKSEPKEWLFVRDSEIWELPESNILPALRLSYNNLPSHMRQWFAYCSIFPKGHQIHRKQLIQLWIANGLVQTNGKMEWEDAGNEIFNALLRRSFFQDIEKDEDGNIRTCNMHDLVHDLACEVGAGECSVVNVRSAENITRRTRHVSLLSSGLPSSSFFASIQRLSPGLRSLISLRYQLTTENSLCIFSSFSRLRALDLCSSQVEKLPDSIGKMIHLRYLNLSSNSIRLLPDSICRLINVQIFNLSRCFSLQSLPRDIRKMSSLRHLNIRDCYGLSKMPIGMGQLPFLQTLSFFIVGSKTGRGIRESQRMNLGGKLEIKGLEHIKDSLDAKEANLISKKNLHSLWLTWSRSQLQGNGIEVIEGIQPHLNLKRIFIEGYEGVTFPSWLTVTCLPNLVEISLSKCRICEHLPPLGKLRHLRVLKIDSLHSLKFIDEEVYGESTAWGFSSLEEFRLYRMPNLEGWSSTQGGVATQLLPCLKCLIIEECPKLTAIPFPSSLQEVGVRKCNEMVLGSLQNLPFLSSLDIKEFDGLENFPQGMLQDITMLDKLCVSSCKSLKTLPVELESITTLTSLSILSCKELVSLPELKNSSLVDLFISGCPQLELSTRDFQHLAVIQTLRLLELPKLTCFPEGIKHAGMLQHLSIVRCSEDVMDLPDWIGSLTSLQVLWFEGCKNRKVLPKGLQYLTALRVLVIKGCDPDLEKRCEKDRGEDWYKISHVPHLYITGEPCPWRIRQLKERSYRSGSGSGLSWNA